MKVRNRRQAEKQELNMTSMIDIVFLLLIFFVMTFKIVELEGDFSIKMPLAGQGTPGDPTDLPLKLRMTANAAGSLTGMALGGTDLGNDSEAFERLRAKVIGQIGTAAPVAVEAGEGPEIEIDADYNLRYGATIQAITAVSGYKDGDQIVKLIEKIKFAKPRT